MLQVGATFDLKFVKLHAAYAKEDDAFFRPSALRLLPPLTWVLTPMRGWPVSVSIPLLAARCSARIRSAAVMRLTCAVAHSHGDECLHGRLSESGARCRSVGGWLSRIRCHAVPTYTLTLADADIDQRATVYSTARAHRHPSGTSNTRSVFVTCSRVIAILTIKATRSSGFFFGASCRSASIAQRSTSGCIRTAAALRSRAPTR